jgi:hypothetical protein
MSSTYVRPPTGLESGDRVDDPAFVLGQLVTHAIGACHAERSYPAQPDRPIAGRVSRRERRT